MSSVPLLLDPADSSWHESEVPLASRGVKLSWICDYVYSFYLPHLERQRRQLRAAEAAESQRKASLWDMSGRIPEPDPVVIDDLTVHQMTTHELVGRHVLPATQTLLAPLYARVPHDMRGRPTVFLSHAWANPVLELVDGAHGTLNAFLEGPMAGEYVWIDFVCYNQHRLAPDRIAFDMEELIGSIGKVAFAVTDTPLFNRIWCLWEMVAVSRTGASSAFPIAPRYRANKVAMANSFFEAFLSVEEASATVQADADKLFAAMLTVFGSLDAANRFIRGQMREHLYGLSDLNKRDR